MIVGVPTEVKKDEHRVGMRPVDVYDTWELPLAS